MKLSPSQVREVLDLSQETFRHWRATLSPLAGRKGYRPCFTHADLLAMALVKALTDEAGIRISYLQGVAVSLFEHCRRQSWAGIERTILIVDPTRARVRFVPEGHALHLDGIGAIVPCRPIVTMLRERLLMDRESVEQGNLHFPPTVVSADGRGRRAS